MTKATEQERAELLARDFHETYERLAPSFGYETRRETRAFDPESANGKLMIAVCAEPQAARRAPTVPVPVPQGWKLVPVEPTMEMVAAGDQKAARVTWLHGKADAVPAVYRAMLAAAPQPPEAAQRKPLTASQYDDILRNLAKRMGRKTLADDISLLRAIERAHDIK